MSVEEQWIEIYRQTLVPLYGYVSRRTGGDRELAEDITQETWLRAILTWRASGLPNEPLAWLKTVARNLLANHYRRHRPESLGDTTPEGPTLDPCPQTPETAALVHRGLGRLPPDKGKLIEAFHLDGRTVREIAVETGLSERAVEGRLYRARRALGDILGQHIEAEGNGERP